MKIFDHSYDLDLIPIRKIGLKFQNKLYCEKR